MVFKIAIIFAYVCISLADTNTTIESNDQEIIKKIITEDGQLELFCAFNLYENKTLEWGWIFNNTAISNDSTFTILNTFNETRLKINRLKYYHVGEYECSGLIEQEVVYSKKILFNTLIGKYYAVLPFCGALLEVFLVSACLFIYEKKCRKKNDSDDEDDAKD